MLQNFIKIKAISIKAIIRFYYKTLTQSGSQINMKESYARSMIDLMKAFVCFDIDNNYTIMGNSLAFNCLELSCMY